MRFFLLFLLPLTAFAQTATLELKKDFIATHNELSFSDIVSVQGNLPAEIMNCSIGSSPILDEERTITRNNLNELISRFPHPSLKCEWTGAEACHISRPAHALDNSELKKEIELELGKVTGGTGRIEILEMGSIENVLVPTNPYSLEVVIPPNASSLPWITAMLKVSEQGENVVTRSFRIHWAWWRQGWMAIQPLTNGNQLNPANFQPAEVNVVETPGTYLDAQLPSEATINRFITAGHFLSQQDFKPTLIVKRGGLMQAHYRKAGMSIDIQVTALEDGARGTVIAVMNTTSKKRFQARVIDDQNVSYEN